MQPDEGEVSAPYGEVGGGVYLLADGEGGMEEKLLRGGEGVGRIGYGREDMEGSGRHLGYLSDLYGGCRVSENGVERGGIVAEGVESLLFLYPSLCVSLPYRPALHETFVCFSLGKEIWGEEMVEVHETQRPATLMRDGADMCVIVGGDGVLLLRRGIEHLLLYGHPAYCFLV